MTQQEKGSSVISILVRLVKGIMGKVHAEEKGPFVISIPIWRSESQADIDRRLKLKNRTVDAIDYIKEEQEAINLLYEIDRRRVDR